MEKLKTLKDLENLCKCVSHCECYEPTPETLREAAIKWIKDLKENEWSQQNGQFSDDETGTYHTRKWIMHFFNITEEELK